MGHTAGFCTAIWRLEAAERWSVREFPGFPTRYRTDTDEHGLSC
jgi:hypothetical protein